MRGEEPAVAGKFAYGQSREIGELDTRFTYGRYSFADNANVDRAAPDQL